MLYWRRNLYISIVMIFIVMSSFTLVTPFMPFFLKSMDVTDNLATWSGLASGAMFLGSALMAPIWGALADRYGKKKIMLISGLGYASMYFLYPLAKTPLQFVIMRGVTGLLAGLVPAATSFVTSNTPEQHMSYALGLFQAFNAAGSICGPLIGGSLVRMSGVATSFRLASCGMFFVTIIPYLTLREEVTKSSENRINVMRDIKICFKNPQLVTAFACLFFVQCGIQISQPTLSLYVSEMAGGGQDSALMSGAVFSVAGLGTVIGANLAGRKGNTGDGISRVRLLLFGLTGAAVFAALQGVWAAILPLVTFRTVFGLFNGVIQVAANVLIATAVSREFRGRAFGVQNAINPIGSMAGPIIGGVVGDAFGLKSSFYASGLALLCAAGVLIGYMRRIQKADETVSASA